MPSSLIAGRVAGSIQTGNKKMPYYLTSGLLPRLRVAGELPTDTGLSPSPSNSRQGGRQYPDWKHKDASPHLTSRLLQLLRVANELSTDSEIKTPVSSPLLSDSRQGGR